MNQDPSFHLPGPLSEGRRQLAEAATVYGRTLGPDEYWWLGVGLAAITLAELGERPYAVGRLSQLIDQAGYKGVQGDWFQRMLEELAELDAEGLLWPLYQRDGSGVMAPTGAAVHPGFDAEHAYFLALAHLGVALALHREDDARLAALTEAILDLVTTGLTPAHEQLILQALQPEEQP